MHKKQKQTIGLKNSLKLLFSSLIVIACISFVSWQTIKCVNKYLEKPYRTIPRLNRYGFKEVMGKTQMRPVPVNRNSKVWRSATLAINDERRKRWRRRAHVDKHSALNGRIFKKLAWDHSMKRFQKKPFTYATRRRGIDK